MAERLRNKHSRQIQDAIVFVRLRVLCIKRQLMADFMQDQVQDIKETSASQPLAGAASSQAEREQNRMKGEEDSERRKEGRKGRWQSRDEKDEAGPPSGPFCLVCRRDKRVTGADKRGKRGEEGGRTRAEGERAELVIRVVS
ncbi:hypothetical protein E2C01_050697 [Portunus trituberculatus]|uniref:Uncharacterized protein n=1 Tax=Portunus trituberculatus TaxID=210409 RepID=A0A5B7G9N6_PORTR|nr:hypothetical protein [Portunus trituberculatus]